MLKLLGALFAAGKLGKLLTTGGTMLLSIVLYAFIFGWAYAVGFVLLIFIHEMGHYIAARLCGLPVGAPAFIPFVGAWVELKEMPHNAHTEAYIGIAGPVVGTLAALACLLFAQISESRLMLALAYAGFMINLFNMLPLSPFDGGRIVQVISPKIWFFGIPLLAALFFLIPSPMLILVALLAGIELWSHWRGKTVLPEGYRDTPNNVRVRYAIYYLGLTAFLAIFAYETHENLAQAMGAVTAIPRWSTKE